MREIKFRGQKLNNEWIKGLLNKDIKGHYRIQFNLKSFAVVVKEKTIGQFTGMIDANGVEVYEGDIISVKMNESDRIGRFFVKTQLPSHLNARVQYSPRQCKYEILFNENKEGLISCEMGFCNEEFKVIGNIHDNPELL